MTFNHIESIPKVFVAPQQELLKKQLTQKDERLLRALRFASSLFLEKDIYPYTHERRPSISKGMDRPIPLDYPPTFEQS